MNKLTDEEASYLRQVLTKQWFKDTPFRLDGLVQRGLLELDLTHYLAKWCLTPAGEQALQEQSPGSYQRDKASILTAFFTAGASYEKRIRDGSGHLVRGGVGQSRPDGRLGKA